MYPLVASTSTPFNASFSLHSNTHTQNHRSPSSASLPTQQASSLGSRSPGLSQGVRLKASQPLPDQDCYYRVSFVNVVPI